jgi:hypothetical protein
MSKPTRNKKSTRRISIVIAKKPKGPPRGDPSALIPYHRKKGDPPLPGCGRPKGSGILGSKLISEAYTKHLGDRLPEDVRDVLELPDDATWADAIAIQQLKAAIQHKETHVNQTAVSELREVTEGKVPERSELSGRNGQPLQAGPNFVVEFVKPGEVPEEE